MVKSSTMNAPNANSQHTETECMLYFAVLSLVAHTLEFHLILFIELICNLFVNIIIFFIYFLKSSKYNFNF